MNVEKFLQTVIQLRIQRIEKSWSVTLWRIFLPSLLMKTQFAALIIQNSQVDFLAHRITELPPWRYKTIQAPLERGKNHSNLIYSEVPLQGFLSGSATGSSSKKTFDEGYDTFSWTVMLKVWPK